MSYDTIALKCIHTFMWNAKKSMNYGLERNEIIIAKVVFEYETIYLGVHTQSFPIQK